MVVGRKTGTRRNGTFNDNVPYLVPTRLHDHFDGSNSQDDDV